MLLRVIFAAIGVVGICLLADYVMDSIARSRDNACLTEEYADAFTGEEEQNAVDSGAQAQQEMPVVRSEAVPAQGLLEIPEKFRTLSGDVPDKAHKLYRLNNDLVGWLYIPGTVNLPVVYRDNEFYLNHAFNEEEDSGGTLFLDQNHPLRENTQNLVIHGHNMYDNSMFGMVAGYSKLSKVIERPFARFSTLYAPENYVIFAVLRVNTDPESDGYFNYIGRPSFANATAFNSYVNELRQRSLFEIPVEVAPSDSLLTLATCIDDDRLVVVFRRVRDGETKDELLAQVELARRKENK